MIRAHRPSFLNDEQDQLPSAHSTGIISDRSCQGHSGDIRIAIFTDKRVILPASSPDIHVAY